MKVMDHDEWWEDDGERTRMNGWWKDAWWCWKDANAFPKTAIIMNDECDVMIDGDDDGRRWWWWTLMMTWWWWWWWYNLQTWWYSPKRKKRPNGPVFFCSCFFLLYWWCQIAEGNDDDNDDNDYDDCDGDDKGNGRKTKRRWLRWSLVMIWNERGDDCDDVWW